MSIRGLSTVLPAGLALAACLAPFWARAEGLQAGPLFSEFRLTLDAGQRTEALGPLFYEEQREEAAHTWALPPLLSRAYDLTTDYTEFDFLYPIMSYDRYGEQYRWHFCQVLSFAGGPTQTEDRRERFTLFPIFFQQRSSDPAEDYTAVFPFYGHLKHRLFRDEIFFAAFPFYGESRKRDVVTRNFLYPFFHLREGNHLRGWQFWPMVGHEHKEVTTRTNGFGDVETVGGHDRFFALWPVYLNERNGIGTENPEWQNAVLPVYSLLRSPNRDSTTVLWPFFSRVDDRARKYREWEVPWPLIVFARGAGKTTTRVWPFFSQAKSDTLESKFYLWPVYKYNRATLPPLDRERTRILFFLYSDLTEKNTDTAAARRSTYLWPLFLSRRDYNGNSRLQILSPLEPFVQGSHKISRDYSPLWSVWRSEHNAKTGTRSQSLLWNLYRHEAGAAETRVSLLFGLFDYRADSGGKKVRVFYLPVGGERAKSGNRRAAQ
jgi:hypothetical protein